MKQNIYPIVLILSLFITFFSCSNKPKKRPRKPISVITLQPQKNKFAYGDKVSVDVKTKLKDGELKNVQLSFEGELIKESNEPEFGVTGFTLNKLGNTSFIAKAEKTDGLKNTRTKTVTVVSDINPEKLIYQVIDNYPHSKESYTQGLEYHNGYLYEGTGENGHSKLMKIDIKTGKAVQSFNLDDKYFGEGITILNDKIYQLTYRAQKGFVYDLKTFAVTDSFSYKSEQGWGLTNDGKNLIMSDGTNVLTWLDPNDFSIVKKLQVADNKSIMNNLNELEYVDGYIYANIYTTNLVVKIDAESGKIVEEINLAGIINLYHRPEDRIDYLNGIAYDKEHNKFYVTGKLFPRLFEVKFVKE